MDNMTRIVDLQRFASEIAAEADVNPRTALARLEGRRVWGRAGQRVDRAIVERGLNSRIAGTGQLEVMP